MRQLAILTSILTLLFASAAVAQDEETDPPQASTFVRIMYLVPDGPPVEIYAAPALEETEETEETEDENDIGVQVAEVQFGQITEFIKAPAGVYRVTVVDAEAEEGDDPLFTMIAELPASEFVTVAAIGSIANHSVEAVLLNENYAAVPDGGGMVSVFHAIENGPAVTIAAGAGEDAIVFFENITYAGRDDLGDIDVNDRDDTGDDMADLVAMQFDMEASLSTLIVPPQFTDLPYPIDVLDESGGLLAALVPGIPIKPNTAHLFVALGDADADTFELMIAEADIPALLAELDD